MIEYLVILGLGTVTGVFTGLLPGIHPNTVVFLSLPLYFSSGIGFPIYGSFLSGMIVSHTFHDFLPAIFLGIPEAESALSTLPGGRMAYQGRGLEAFQYTVRGGLYSVLLLIGLTPLFLLFLEPIYAVLEDYMFYVLVFFLGFIVFRSDTPWLSFITAFLSGALGLLSFSTPINQNFVLMPVFSGLFAIPSLFFVFKSDFRIPGQKNMGVSEFRSLKGSSLGLLAGLNAAVVPGVGAAVSTSFLTPLIDTEAEFLAGMGAVNTSDAIMSLLTLYILGKARSGASVAVQNITSLNMPLTVFLVGLTLLSVSVSAPLAILVSEKTVGVLRSLEVSRAVAVVAVFLALSNLFWTGPLGLLIMLTAAAIGYSALLAGERAACMAVLLIPAILFHSGHVFI